MACAGRGLSWRSCRDLLSSSADRGPCRRVRPWSVRRPRVTIVRGLDQHRAQITAEWLDTATGDVSRARGAPTDPAGGRGVAGRFGGHALEVALEATTGWRFVLEELQAA